MKDPAIIYNVTVLVERSVAGEWLQWMLDEHIPQVMDAKCFTGYRVVRLLEVDESEGITYAIQYEALSKADYNRYIQLHADQLRKKTMERWGGKVVAFRSVMEVVQ